MITVVVAFKPAVFVTPVVLGQEDKQRAKFTEITYYDK